MRRAALVFVGITIALVEPAATTTPTFRYIFKNMSLAPWAVYDEKRGTFSGFMIDLIQAAHAGLQEEPEIVTLATPPQMSEADSERMHSEYLHSGKADFGLGSVNALYIPGTEKDYIQTVPYITYRHTVLVRTQRDQRIPMWRLFLPFSTDLWLLVCGTIVALAALLAIVDMLHGAELYSLGQAATTLYFAFAALLCGDMGHDTLITYTAGRVLRVSFLFLFMVLQATYTANLASILTTDRTKLDGPTTLRQLRETKTCMLPHVANAGGIDYVRSDSVIDNPLVSFRQRLTLEDCIEMLLNGTVDAVVEQRWTAHAHIVTNPRLCKRLQIVESVDFLIESWAFLGLLSNATNVMRLSQAILTTFRTGVFDALVAKHFHIDRQCDAALADSERITPEQISGAFVIFSAGAVLAIIAAFSSSRNDTLLETHTELPVVSANQAQDATGNEGTTDLLRALQGELLSQRAMLLEICEGRSVRKVGSAIATGSMTPPLRPAGQPTQVARHLAHARPRRATPTPDGDP
eukprot:TRINITY_DN35697_c0_g1_i2.p1 TRINITY_DN35697_c0_g1~~TRINITY_DN35697_c0_g1_i2.p1  ORF type:complete len:521 (+),score=69.19 TRINITY_DN35697_c0_g1_i2:107-1669(+)